MVNINMDYALTAKTGEKKIVLTRSRITKLGHLKEKMDGINTITLTKDEVVVIVKDTFNNQAQLQKEVEIVLGESLTVK